MMDLVAVAMILNIFIVIECEAKVLNTLIALIVMLVTHLHSLQMQRLDHCFMVVVFRLFLTQTDILV